MKHKRFIIQYNEIKAASKIFLYTTLQTNMMTTIHSSQVVKIPLEVIYKTVMLD